MQRACTLAQAHGTTKPGTLPGLFAAAAAVYPGVSRAGQYRIARSSMVATSTKAAAFKLATVLAAAGKGTSHAVRNAWHPTARACWLQAYQRARLARRNAAA